tara:strand:- start:72 stop:398 length:327 start_codon:yes stop_codon:yes gene_type:complete
MARQAEMRLQRALASSRRRASNLSKKLKASPAQDTIAIAAGGAAAGFVPGLLPTNLQNIAGIPTPAILGVGLVVYSTMGTRQTKLAGQLGQGMLAVAAAQYASSIKLG